MLKVEIELDEKELRLAVQHWCNKNGFRVGDDAKITFAAFPVYCVVEIAE
jgi:hypothetical protein